MLLLSYSHKMGKKKTLQNKLKPLQTPLPRSFTSDNRTPHNDHPESVPDQTPTCSVAAESEQSSPAVSPVHVRTRHG